MTPPSSPDERAIPDGAVLWRRVYPESPGWVLFDKNLGRYRPSSGAFKDNSRGPVSAYLASETSVGVVMAGHDDFGLVALRAGLVRSLGLTIERDEASASGPGHVLLIGAKTDSIRSKLAKAAEWVILPRGLRPTDPT